MMVDQVESLFRTDGFRTRFDCGPSWSDELVLSHMMADSITAFCFFALPIIFIWCTRRRPDIPMGRQVRIFSLATILCGFTHIAGAIIPYWWPVYRFDALLKWSNALAWVFVVITVSLAIPRVLRMLTPLRIARMQEELVTRSTFTAQALADHLIEKKVILDDTLKEDFKTLGDVLAGLKELAARAQKDVEDS